MAVEIGTYSHLRLPAFAEHAFFPTSQEEITELYRKEANYTVIGGGSNLLFTENCASNLIFDAKLPKFIKFRGVEVEVSASVNINQLIMACLQHSLGGLEFLSGVPAHVGGAVKMNAGAFGNNVGDFVTKVGIITANGMEYVSNYKKDYRQSSLNGFIYSVVFSLVRKPPVVLKKEISANIQHRLKTQPLRERNIGCFFKNPEGESAGRLIDYCGLKGKMQGGAMVSHKHANFLINTGKARYFDFKTLMEIVQDNVYQKTGIFLEKEIKEIL